MLHSCAPVRMNATLMRTRASGSAAKPELERRVARRLGQNPVGQVGLLVILPRVIRICRRQLAGR
jgi:hypothetical protein